MVIYWAGTGLLTSKDISYSPQNNPESHGLQSISNASINLSTFLNEEIILNGTGGPENLTDNSRNFYNLLIDQPYRKCKKAYIATRDII